MTYNDPQPGAADSSPTAPANTSNATAIAKDTETSADALKEAEAALAAQNEEVSATDSVSKDAASTDSTSTDASFVEEGSADKRATEEDGFEDVAAEGVGLTKETETSTASEQTHKQIDDKSANAYQDQPGQPTKGQASNSQSAQDSPVQDQPAQADDPYRKKYMYLMAEFDNYKKQSFKERAELIKYASTRVLCDLLDIIDDFERALSVKTQDLENFRLGVQMTAKNLTSTLEKHGLQGDNTQAGDRFDPSVHEALSRQLSEDVQPGHIVHVHKKAYRLHDRLVRPAQVVVAEAQAEEQIEAQAQTDQQQVDAPIEDASVEDQSRQQNNEAAQTASADVDDEGPQTQAAAGTNSSPTVSHDQENAVQEAPTHTSGDKMAAAPQDRSTVEVKA